MYEQPFTDEEKGPPHYESTQQLDSAEKSFNDQPSSYDSLFGKIKATHEASDNKVSLAKSAWGLISTSVGFIVWFGMTLCVPLANIVIGSVFLHDCTIQRFIPIYLVVCGAYTLVQNLVGLMKKMKYRGQDNAVPQNERELTLTENALNCFNRLLTCFMFAWFIAGNVWIYSIHNTVNTSDSASPHFCNYTLYYYAFWVTILVYIFIGWPISLDVICAGISKKKF